MAKVRQLFNNVEIDVAKRKRVCYHNRAKHSIAKGERCMVIKNTDGVGSKNYCVECGTAIIDRAGKDLMEIRNQLTS